MTKELFSECIDPFSKTFVREKRAFFPYEIARKHLVLALEEQGESVVVGMKDPLNIQLLHTLSFISKKELVAVYVDEHTLSQAIESCYKTDLSIHSSEKNERQLEEEGEDLLDMRDQSPSVQLLNRLLQEAIQKKASDIHIEPSEGKCNIRLRIDGVLHFRSSPQKELVPQLITRIKVLSKLNIAETRLPQDGRLKARFGGRSIDFRVSTVPTAFGERVVLRLLDKGSISLGLDSIGLSAEKQELLKTLLRQPQGMILVTGPTGSGKTTTLYSCLTEIQSSEINIMTIEDPVEFKLPSMAQIGVNHKIDLTFQTGLRHILRQDPDVIMVGEIRDQETAEIAIESSLTGHLVMSTLHTNDAPSALTRLVDMGIEPYLLSSSILAVIAQRLVRCLCSHCKQFDEQADSYTHVGCQECSFTGYQGRAAIYEIMPMGKSIKTALLHSADSSTIKTIAIEKGMSTLFDEGMTLVKKGITSKEEVLRIAEQIMFE